MARALLTVPPSVRRGEVFEVRAIIAHPMETGYRAGADGARVPRDVLRRFTCRYDGEVVFAADLYPAVAANPYLSFHALATSSGPMTFTWEGDNGFAQTEIAAIVVT
ncbi:MAG: thiosulfate oxidation carrier complex protein SoxZ [Burkholderiales bacterium]